MPLSLAPPPIAESLDTGEAVVTVPVPLPAEVPPIPNYGGEVLVVAAIVTLVLMLIRSIMTILPYVLSVVIGIAILKYYIL